MSAAASESLSDDRETAADIVDLALYRQRRGERARTRPAPPAPPALAATSVYWVWAPVWVWGP